MGKAKKELRRVREALGHRAERGATLSEAVAWVMRAWAHHGDGWNKDRATLDETRAALKESKARAERDHADLVCAMETIHRAEKAIDSVAGLPQKRPLDAAVEELVKQRNYYHDAKALEDMRRALKEALDLGDEADRDPSVNDLATVARARLRELL